MMDVVLKETGDVDMVAVWSADEKTLIAIVHSDLLVDLVPASGVEDKWRWIMGHLPITLKLELIAYNSVVED